MYYSIITIVLILPIFSAVFSGLGGFILGRHGSNLITCAAMGVTTIISWGFFVLMTYLPDTIVYFKLKNWITFNELFLINWEILFDSLTITMLVVVNTISFLVHVYSVEYMNGDPHSPRFMSYLSLFTFFMLILVTSNNFLQLLVGWEGVGLCSFLLINFWYSRPQANKAAIKAMLVNKIGDVGIILALIYIYSVCYTLNFDAVFLIFPEYVSSLFDFGLFQVATINLVTFFLLMGAIGKSAQLGLHTWLPDAMEGPTPVSALIHAATMVTAGVFLIIRCSFLFELAPQVLVIMSIFGILTAVFGSIIGAFLFDIKKIIAYSTCSQLGYMLFSCGSSNYTAGIYHLTTHAFFKALLFLTAGSIIHSMSNEQDFRRFGNLKDKTPLTYSIFVIGSLSLIGTPFLSGFYSKDLILETVGDTFGWFGNWLYLLALIATFLTAFYSTRLLYLTFIALSKETKVVYDKVHESPKKIMFSLIFLAICSIFSGFFFEEIFLGYSSEFFKNAIEILPRNQLFTELEYVNCIYKLAPLIMTTSGIFFSIYTIILKKQIMINIHSTNKFLYDGKQQIFEFFNQKWFFDKIYNNLIDKYVFEEVTNKTLTQNYICFWESWYSVGPDFFLIFLNNLSRRFNTTGFLQHYVALSYATCLISLFVSQFWYNEGAFALDWVQLLSDE